MLDLAGFAIFEHQQARLVATGERLLRYQLVGQVVVEFVDFHSDSKNGRLSWLLRFMEKGRLAICQYTSSNVRIRILPIQLLACRVLVL